MNNYEKQRELSDTMFLLLAWNIAIGFIFWIFGVTDYFAKGVMLGSVLIFAIGTINEEAKLKRMKKAR